MKKTVSQNKVRLKEFLAESMGISNNRAKEIIDTRNVFVNDRRIWMAGHILNKGDCVEIKEYTEKKTPPVKSLNILYESGELIAVEKPAGMVSNEKKGSVEDILRRQKSNPKILAAHRLDKQTSGVMLFVKSRAILEKYKNIWKEHKVKKIYLAVCLGEARFESKQVDLLIENRLALSCFEKISSGNGLTFFKVTIDTGRKHQIRIHAASMGYPVVGDSEYGNKTVKNELARAASRQMLHAYELVFPEDGREISVKCEMPDDIKFFAEKAGFKGGFIT